MTRDLRLCPLVSGEPTLAAPGTGVLHGCNPSLVETIGCEKTD